MPSQFIPDIMETWYPNLTSIELFSKVLERAEDLGIEDSKISLTTSCEYITFSEVPHEEREKVLQVLEELKDGDIKSG